jgi:tRNA threonylcarbamoyladenosine biosynthesis protein TsaB
LNLLYLDTATEACTVGVWRCGTIFSRFEIAPREHTKWLLPMTESVLQEAELSFELLDGIAFNRGPGSFTGVRIAVSAAFGMAMGCDRPVLGLSSLAVLARSQCDQMAEGAVVHAALDARMGEVYYGAFVRRDGQLLPMGAERVVNPEVLIAEWQTASEPTTAFAVGSGFGRYPALVAAKSWQSVEPELYPDARFGVALAAAMASDAWQLPSQAAPVYLRDEVATPKAG